MATEKPTITWPDILNYLHDRGYFASLSPIENKLHDALLYKLNNLFFPEYLEISNTELHGMTGLTVKAIIQARDSLIKKACYDNWIWRYKSREHQRLSGHYFFNYELIMNWIGTRQELRKNSASRKLENVPKEYAENGNDLNTTEPNFKKTTTDNKGQQDGVDDDGISIAIKEEIKEILYNQGLAKSKIQKAIREYGWERVIPAFTNTREKYTDGEIGKFVGYFLKTLEGMADSEKVIF